MNKRTIILKLGLLFALSLSAGWAHGQPASYFGGCASSSSCTVSSIPAGSTVWINATNYSATGVPTLTDNGVAVGAQVSGYPVLYNFSGALDYLWVIPNEAGSHTFAFSVTNSSYPTMLVAVTSNTDLSNPISSITNTLANGSSISCSPVTTVSGQLVLSFATFAAGGTISPTDGATVGPNTSNTVGSYINATGTSHTSSWSASGTNNLVCDSIAVKYGAPGLADPTFSPTPGTYPSFSLPTVTLAGPAGATICYALNATPAATVPGTCDAGSTTYSSGFLISTTTTVNAISTQSGQTNSGVATGVYTIRYPMTWFVRADGGTRYDATDNPTGQCNGLTDGAYSGTGVNQNCAFSSVQWLYLTSGYGVVKWVMAGGDTAVIRGCAAFPNEVNPSAPHCRVGWVDPSNAYGICHGISSGCSIPAPPNGTSGAHTRILGGCAYDGNCNPVISYPYTSNNLTQLFGGFNVGIVINLDGSNYIDVEGFEITSHNGACTRVGSPSYPAACSVSAPMSDFASIGIATNNTTTNLTLQDLYIHGMNSEGIYGAIGAGIVATRVSLDFNTFAGWNFDDGTVDGTGATLTQSHVWMEGNGCLEQYPIVNAQFPAMSCWDINNAGFGDSWSGQNTAMASFTCDHCTIQYNVKDGAMGPHTVMGNLSLTNSVWQGNVGAQGKWGLSAGSTFLFENNLVIGNCSRMLTQLPGAIQGFAISTGLPGSYINGCRGNDIFAFQSDASSSVNFTNNTWVLVDDQQDTVFDLNCNTSSACSSTPYNYTNNIFLGYTVSNTPGLFYTTDSSVTFPSNNNIQFGIRNGATCAVNGVICSDPLLVGEPAQGSIPPTSTLDSFNFHLTSGSPAIHAGTTPCATYDYAGNAQTSPCTIGAYVFGGAPGGTVWSGILSGRIQ